MAIAQEGVSEIKGGFNKQIDAGAKNLMFEILQRHQYQFPIKSTVREIVCNGLDSVKERDTARDILTGSAKVEDYYIEREGELYKDSKFDSAYYDLNHLSTDSNVYVTYYEGKEMEKDRVEFKDYGVGLWGQRLVGYWNLGHSTKRNSRNMIGKFGLGNKSPLSINDTFSTVTVYNGKKAKFNVYSTKVESITPRFNLETGKENEKHTVTLTDGTPYEFYVEETDEKNCLTVVIEAKKHHKSQYIEAVQSQLLYFPSVILRVFDKHGREENLNVFSPVLFENEQIVISDNNYYSKPHIVMNGVNYGYIQFDELELEEKIGNIGIKVQAEEIEVSPSRESLIWNDTTKATVLQRFKECAEIATHLIQEELHEPDFVKWLRVCASISSRSWAKKGNVISRLSSIIDINSLAPTFKDSGLKFSHTILRPANVRKVTMETLSKANRITKKVDRIPVTFLGDTIHLPILHAKERVSPRKDKFLLSSVYTNGFLIFQEYTEERLNQELEEYLFSRKEMKEEDFKVLKKQALEIIKNLKESIELIDYDSIVVPDSFIGGDSEEEESEEVVEQRQAVLLSHEERRKLEGKTVLFTPRNKVDLKLGEGRFYEWQKLEVPFTSINDWDEKEIYYGTDKNAEMLEFVALLTRDTRQESFTYPRAANVRYNGNFDGGLFDHVTKTSANERYRSAHFFHNKNIKLVKVSESNAKYYRDFSHISKFFCKFKNNTLTMSSILIQWNTSRKILPLLNQIAFLWNYPFDQEKQTLYREIVAYVRSNHRDVLSFDRPKSATESNSIGTAYEDLVKHLDKVESFQTFLASSPTPEEVQEVAKELWGNPTVSEAQAIDLELWNKFKELLDWATPVCTLLNQLDCLTGMSVYSLEPPTATQARINHSLPENLEAEVRWYSHQKGVI